MRLFTKETYDVFISYRRQGGEDEAWKLKLFLEKLGYRVFMDREALRSGDFNEQLYNRIEECKDFLLVCSPHALDRCQNEDDWVRKEIAHAIEKNKNIIPIWLNGFDGSQMEGLPSELECLRRLQAVTPQNATYEESVRKLSQYLHAKPVKRYLHKILSISGIIAVAALMVVLGILSFSGRSSDFPGTAKEKKQVEAVQAAACDQLGVLDVNLKYFNQVIAACQNYVAGYTNDADAVRRECINRKEYLEKQSFPQWGQFPGVDGYAYLSHLDELSAIVQRTGDYVKYINYIEYIVFESRLENDQKKTVLEQFSNIAQQDAELASSETFLLFLPVTQQESTLKILLDMSKYWYQLSAFGKSWIKGTEREAELERSVEISRNSRYQSLITCQSASGVDLSTFDIQLER